MQKAKAYAVEGLEEGGDDPKTAQDVVHALYAKYKKNVSIRRPPRPTQRDPAPDQPSPRDDPKKSHGPPHRFTLARLNTPRQCLGIFEIRLETQPRYPTAVLAVVFGPALTDDPRPRAA